jgi:hypothetical protein
MGWSERAARNRGFATETNAEYTDGRLAFMCGSPISEFSYS